MLGSDRSRGYCLEMICADFLAGAHADGASPEVLLFSIARLLRLLPHRYQQQFLHKLNEVPLSEDPARAPRAWGYKKLHRQVFERDRWRYQQCGRRTNLEVHHLRHRSQQGDDAEYNLITLCSACHCRRHSGDFGK